MAQPVWVLSVDLQTKTATFQTGMADAARSAKSAFADIKTAAKDGADGVTQGSTNVRAALGLIDNTIRGNHAAAMADLVREFSDTKLVMMALPFAATIGGIGAVAAIAVEVAAKIKEWRQEQEKLNNETTKFGTAVQESFNGLDEKILTAEERADELTNNHLGALQKKLELIDHQSMADLVKELETIAKAAEPVFKALEGHWYSLDNGSAGATHALENFKVQYASLLMQGKDKDAGDLLRGTRESAERILEAQKQAASTGGYSSVATNGPLSHENQMRLEQARATLSQARVGWSKEDVKAQEQLLKVLDDQITAEGKLNELKKLEGANDTRQVSNDDSARRASAARQAVAIQQAIAEQVLTADRATAAAQLEIQNSTVQQRLDSDLEFAKRDFDIKTAANREDIQALDKAGKDYTNQLKALNDKALEIEQAYSTQVTELRARASVAQYKKDLTDLEQSEREKIAATEQGSAERLAAIDAAIKVAQEHSLQDSEFVRQLAQQRVETARQFASEEAKLKADAGKEEADNTLKMAQLQLAAERERQAVVDSARRISEDQMIAEQLAASEREFQIKQQALQQEAAALDTSAKDYENKLKTIQDKELQLIRAHENEKTQIEDQATKARNDRMLDGYKRLDEMAAKGLTSVLMRHQTFAAMVASIGDQVVSAMMTNAIKSALADDFSRERDAAKAARQAFNFGLQYGGPAAPVLAPVLAAGAFASVMAFEGGTDMVRGFGRGDTVPAMLTPGEGIVPGGVMDGLRNMARDGGFTQKPSMTVHIRPTYHVQAIDGNGMSAALEKHSDTLQRHFEKTLRKMNR
jgi:hypothetical protein